VGDVAHSDASELDMPRARKINLAKVLASLDTICPKYEKIITPAEMQRIDFEKMKCPACGEQFAHGRERADSGLSRAKQEG